MCTVWGESGRWRSIQDQGRDLTFDRFVLLAFLFVVEIQHAHGSLGRYMRTDAETGVMPPFVRRMLEFDVEERKGAIVHRLFLFIEVLQGEAKDPPFGQFDMVRTGIHDSRDFEVIHARMVIIYAKYEKYSDSMYICL